MQQQEQGLILPNRHQAKAKKRNLRNFKRKQIKQKYSSLPVLKRSRAGWSSSKRLQLARRGARQKEEPSEKDMHAALLGWRRMPGASLVSGNAPVCHARWGCWEPTAYSSSSWGLSLPSPPPHTKEISRKYIVQSGSNLGCMRVGRGTGTGQ